MSHLAEQIRRAAAVGRSITIDPLAHAPGAVRVQLRQGCELVAFEVTAHQLDALGADGTDHLVAHLLAKLADLIDLDAPARA